MGRTYKLRTMAQMKSPNGFLDAPNSRFEDPAIGEAGCADVQKLISRRVLLELGPRNEGS